MTRYWPPNGLNWGYFSDPEVDKMGEESLAEFDVAKRNALIGKMHERLVADAPTRSSSCMTSTRKRYRRS
jgi:peptide/nickel transport system substrate-binding protein